MTPVIKAGNCLTVVLRYWIWGQFSRHNLRQLDVKSLSSEIGSKAEQTHRSWYQHQREKPDPRGWHSAHLLPYPP